MDTTQTADDNQQDQVTETDTPVAPPQEDDKPQDNNLDGKSKQDEPEEDVFEFEKDDNGNYVIRTEDSVYKGRTKQEAAKALLEGKKSAEKYIRELRAKTALKLPEGVKEKAIQETVDESEPEIAIRSRDEIASEIAPKVIRQYGVDAKKLNWTNQQWKEYAAEMGLESWEVQDEREQIKEARNAINQYVERVYAEETKRMAIAEVIDEEHEAVVKAVADSGIDPSQFDYQAVLEAVVQNKNNYNKFGVLKSGRIVAEALRQLHKLEKEQGKSAYQRKIEEDIAKASKAKATIPSSGTSGSGNYRPKPKAYTSLDDALEAAKKEHGL